MDALPHHYRVRVAADSDEAPLDLESPGLPTLASAAPKEFGGPGDRWSPETLTVAALVDCFTLGFRTVSRMSRFEWTHLECEGEGRVDRDADGAMAFVELRLRARLEVPTGTRPERAERLLRKAESVCIVSRSLRAPVHLDVEVVEAAAD